MILVDSSVWVDHFRRGDAVLSELLGRGEVLGHPFVLGEIALGSLAKRTATLQALRDLPQAVVAGEGEVMGLIEREHLAGMGIGYVDVHLLAATRLSRARLWTRDRRLAGAAAALSLGA